MSLFNVHPGQVWKDKDRRETNRLLVVERVGEQYAYLRSKFTPSLKTRIRLTNLVSRFELIK